MFVQRATLFALEFFPQVLEKALALLVVIVLQCVLKCAQRLALRFGELFRNLYHHLGVLVAVAASVHILNALAAQAEHRAALCALRHGVLHLAVDGGHHHVCTRHGLAVGDGHCHMHVVAVPLEQGVGPHAYQNDKVARGPAVCACVAKACQTQALVVVNAGGNIHFHALCVRHMARAMAFLAWLFDDLALAAAARARP